MRNVIRALISAVTLSFLLLAGLSAAGNSKGQGEVARSYAPIPNQYIVVFNDDVKDVPGLARAMAAVNGFKLRHIYTNALKGYSATMPPGLAQAIAGRSEVMRVEPNLPIYIVSDESSETVPLGITRIEADTSISEVDVDVAVIDTGINHKDLNVFYGETFVPESECETLADGLDDHGHGTHVAGTIAAINNEDYVIGVAPGARLWSLKTQCSNGSGSTDNIISAINAIINEDGTSEVEVINISLGGIGFHQALRDALTSAVNAGIVVVVAAGNESRNIYGADGNFDLVQASESIQCQRFGRNCNSDSIPAAYPEVATVSAMDASSNNFASFSNFSTSSVNSSHGVNVTSDGAGIDLAAPGVNVLSTQLGGTTSFKSGTSMAAPHVAGVAALYIAQNQITATSAEQVYAIRQQLIDCAQNRTDYMSDDPDGNYENVVKANCVVVLSNNPPNANDDTATTNEDTPVNIDVLANDSDEDGNPLTVTPDLNPDHGTAKVIQVDNKDVIHYTPDLDFYGTDSFTYTVSDGIGGSDTAAVTITVTPVNDDPIASNDSYATTTDTKLVVAAPGVLSNDMDVDGDSLVADLKADPTNGTLTLSPDGSFSYVPKNDFSGEDSFTYTVSDGNGGTAEAAVTITVNNIDTPTSMHVASLEGSASSVRNKWEATVMITVHDISGAVVAGATVTGDWSGGTSNSCITGSSGSCEVLLSKSL